MNVVTKPGSTTLARVWRLLHGFPDGYAFFQTPLGDNVAAANLRELKAAIQALWAKSNPGDPCPATIEVEYLEIHG